MDIKDSFHADLRRHENDEVRREREAEEVEQRIAYLLATEYAPHNPRNLWEALTEGTAEDYLLLSKLLTAGEFDAAGRKIDEMTRRYWEGCARAEADPTYRAR